MAAKKTAKTKARRSGRSAGALLRIKAFELSEPSVFENDVRLEIAPRHTVLVGRNGAGKSALLEGLAHASQLALGIRSKGEEVFVPRFRCEVTEGSESLTYEFCQDFLRRRSLMDHVEPEYDWSESCWRGGERKKAREVWSVASSTARASDGTRVKLPGGVGLLSAQLSSASSFTRDADTLRSFFANIRHVAPGVPRERRRVSLVSRSSGREPWTAFVPGHRVDEICATLLRWWSEDSTLFGEFESVGQRMGLFKRARASVMDSGETGKQYGTIVIDGTEIGHVADGTLRVIEILCALLRPSSSLLLIEEPETSIHPGLLRKLLAEVEAYSSKFQVVLTTHSPQVVAWASPSDVRLVRRDGDETTVSSLTRRQVEQVTKYLTDDGTLGDFVFSGALDD